MHLWGGTMKNLLRIGQVCRLYGISLDTLRYYDHKGLLKPMVNKENGYRYYSLEHLDILEMILVGKHLEIPLDQMKEKIANESIDGYLDMLEEHGQRIQERRNILEQLSQYTEEMTTLLKKIREFENDYTFSKVITEENLDITIFNVPLKNIFNERVPRIDGIESIEQWITYNVNNTGELRADEQILGLSILNPSFTNNELRAYLDQMVGGGQVSKYCLTGNYNHIDFWGSETDLLNYLKRICHKFKLKDTDLIVKFCFALLHHNMEHEYFVEIYFTY